MRINRSPSAVVKRGLGVGLLTILLLAAGAPNVAASPDRVLRHLLGMQWTTILEQPKAESPYFEGSRCVELAGRGIDSVVVPFAPIGVDDISCTVSAGTRIFVSAFGSECSTVEAEPYFGRTPPELRQCVREVNSKVKTPIVTVDGRRIPLTEVQTNLLNVVLPDDNILDFPPGTVPAGTRAQSVGLGWVALLEPLPVGTHTIRIRVTGEYLGDPLDVDNTTTIIVTPATG